jgi:hypothetical protein
LVSTTKTYGAKHSGTALVLASPSSSVGAMTKISRWLTALEEHGNFPLSAEQMKNESYNDTRVFIGQFQRYAKWGNARAVWLQFLLALEVLSDELVLSDIAVRAGEPYFQQNWATAVAWLDEVNGNTDMQAFMNCVVLSDIPTWCRTRIKLFENGKGSLADVTAADSEYNAAKSRLVEACRDVKAALSNIDELKRTLLVIPSRESWKFLQDLVESLPLDHAMLLMIPYLQQNWAGIISELDKSQMSESMRNVLASTNPSLQLPSWAQKIVLDLST